MPGVPDYRDTPTPTPHRIPRALETGKLDPGWLPAAGAGSVTSAAFQGEVAARIAGDDALSNAISALALDDLVDVSAPAPNDADALVWNSAQGQWVASAMAGGAGSVTSADFVSLRSDVGRISVVLSGAISAIAANSAQMTSADNANSAAAAAVSARLDSTNTVVSNQGSAIVANSAQMTSADNALSAAINAVSVDLVSLRSDVGRISVALSGAISAIAANSAQMTSADNANSAAAAAVSARLDSTNTVVSNQGSAIVANSAQMTSADNAISAAAAAVSTRLDSTNTVVSNQGSAIVANSAQMTSADNAVSAAAAAVSVRLDSVIAAGLVSAGPVKRVLAGNQLVTATVPTSVSGFTFTCSAGVGYSFQFGLYTSNPISLAGNKWVLSFPSSSPVIALYAQGGCVGGVSVLNVDRTDVTMANVTVSAVGVPIACFIRGTFRCSANGGTMNLRVANNVTATTNASAITLLAGSYGYVWRMA